MEEQSTRLNFIKFLSTFMCRWILWWKCQKEIALEMLRYPIHDVELWAFTFLKQDTIFVCVNTALPLQRLKSCWRSTGFWSTSCWHRMIFKRTWSTRPGLIWKPLSMSITALLSGKVKVYRGICSDVVEVGYKNRTHCFICKRSGNSPQFLCEVSGCKIKWRLP